MTLSIFSIKKVLNLSARSDKEQLLGSTDLVSIPKTSLKELYELFGCDLIRFTSLL